MTELMLPPSLIMLIGAGLITVLRGWLRTLAVLAAPLATLWSIWQLGDGVLLSAPLLGHAIEWIEADKLRRLFASAFALIGFASGLYALRQARTAELAAAQGYVAGAIGVCFAGDLIALFVFWEWMALCSTVLIWCGGTESSRRAGVRYGVLHLVGGAVLMLGIAGMMVRTGSVDIGALGLDHLDSWLILIAVLINVAAPPLNAWIADAYPESTISGTVILSACTTKTAVLALILMFPGTSMLIGIGLLMIFHGLMYALLESDMRRMLAYSIVNQLGFMLVGIGIGTEMSINGAAAHAVVGIFYTSLLFMAAGAVMLQTGRRCSSELGGLYRSMPLTAACAIVGGMAMSAFPLTSGFVAKSMVSQAAADQHLAVVWSLLTAASVGVFLLAGLKFPWRVFFDQDSGVQAADPDISMRTAMILLALASIAIGCAPGALYALLPYPVDYVPYTAAHVVSQLQLLLFTALGFFIARPWLQHTRLQRGSTRLIDTDWLYRNLLPTVFHRIAVGWEHVETIIEHAAKATVARGKQALLTSLRPSGWLGALRSAHVAGLTVLLVLTVLTLRNVWRN